MKKKNKAVPFNKYLRIIPCKPFFFFENNSVHIKLDNPRYKVPIKTDCRPVLYRSLKKSAMNKVEFVGNKYIPQYAGDFFSKPWYERDMMG